MRLTVLCLAPVILLAGCTEKTAGDNVREAYENKAAVVDAQAAQQPTDTATKIYESRAEAIREEGKDREKGLEGGEPSSGQGTTQGGGKSGG